MSPIESTGSPWSSQLFRGATTTLAFDAGSNVHGPNSTSEVLGKCSGAIGTQAHRTSDASATWRRVSYRPARRDCVSSLRLTLAVPLDVCHTAVSSLARTERRPGKLFCRHSGRSVGGVPPPRGDHRRGRSGWSGAIFMGGRDSRRRVRGAGAARRRSQRRCGNLPIVPIRSQTAACSRCDSDRGTFRRARLGGSLRVGR